MRKARKNWSRYLDGISEKKILHSQKQGLKRYWRRWQRRQKKHEE